MKKTTWIVLPLLLAITMAAGCTPSYAEEQWVKEDTVKYAEQHIGYKLLPDVEDHSLRFGTPGKIGEDTRVYRIRGDGIPGGRWEGLGCACYLHSEER